MDHSQTNDFVGLCGFFFYWKHVAFKVYFKRGILSVFTFKTSITKYNWAVFNYT